MRGGDDQHAPSGLVAVGTPSSQGWDPLNQTVEGSLGRGLTCGNPRRPRPAPPRSLSGSPGMLLVRVRVVWGHQRPFSLRSQHFGPKPTAPVCSEPCPFSKSREWVWGKQQLLGLTLCSQGELNGQKGLVPSNFLEEVPDDVEVYLSDAPSRPAQDTPPRAKAKRVSGRPRPAPSCQAAPPAACAPRSVCPELFRRPPRGGVPRHS